MVKLSEKSRKILRKIFMGLGAASVSLLFQACYGMPQGGVEIFGTVTSKTDDAPIPGIGISTDGSPDYYINGQAVYTYVTNEYGNFHLYPREQSSYTLTFTDIDGPANGSFKTLTKTVGLNEIYHASLNVQLEEDDE